MNQLCACESDLFMSFLIVLSEFFVSFPGGSDGKDSGCSAGRSLGQEDPLEEDMATHSSILAWKIPWTEESGRLWSVRSQSWT